MQFTQQAIYDTIKTTDNSQLWSTCGLIAKHIQKLNKTLSKLNDDKVATLIPLDCSDEELRTRVKTHLVNKLNDGSLTASEIGQLKEVFPSLVSSVDDLTIEYVDYENCIVECPKCGANVHEPPVDSM